MNHFRYGFGRELVDIMTKEAARREASSPTRMERLKKGLSAGKQSATARGLSRHLRRSSKGVMTGALFHKLVDPSSTAGEAVGSGLGVQAGGEIGSAMARHLGVKGSKGELAAALAGSALGLRYMRSRQKAKREKEQEKALLREAMQ